MQDNQFDYQSLLPIGTLLQMGKYRVDKYLSSGGFGNTYVITNLQFEEQFAMKEFFMKGINERNVDNTTISVSNKTNRPQFEQQREKFKKEARRLRKLHNDHIVKVHDLFEENGTAYYVMDYIDGESLSNFIKRTGKSLKEEMALSILTQVLDALQVVHEKLIWHLDLKPANIMLDNNGNAVLIDFGASKQMSVSDGYTSTTTAMCYTKGYAPAEQVDQKIDNIGPWTDLYALGATLYNLLTKKDPPLISEIFIGNAFDFPTNISEKTKNLILLLMTPNHEKRPSSVQEVRAYLNSSQEQYDIDSEVTVLSPKRVESKKSTWKYKIPFSPKAQKAFVGVVFLTVLIGVIVVGSRSCGNGKALFVDTDSIAEVVDSVVDIMAVETIGYVYDMSYKSSLGICSYTGDVDSDNIPDSDNGEATFKDGRFYRGPFRHGIFEGKNAYFKYDNGDTFEGEFRNNSFYKGKYTIKKDGSYFIGTFKNGQPDKGQWYDSKRSSLNKQREQEQYEKDLLEEERKNIENALDKAIEDNEVKFGLG